MQALRALSIALFAAASLSGCSKSRGPGPATTIARAFDIRAICAAASAHNLFAIDKGA